MGSYFDKHKKDKTKPEANKEKIEESNYFANKSSCFCNVEATNLYKVFMEQSSPSLKVDIEIFQNCLTALEPYGFKPPQDPLFASKLYEHLDTNHDGSVDLNEFVSGLLILCKGDPAEKIKLSFQSYDFDNDGVISKDEMTLMFKKAWVTGFTALCVSSGSGIKPDELDEFSSKMAKEFTTNAFEALDTDGDGSLNLEEFTKFALAAPAITATLNGFQMKVEITI